MKKAIVGFNAAMPFLVEGRLRNFASCLSCHYSEGETCTNEDVLPAFDMVKDEARGREWCPYWCYKEREGY